MVVPTADCGDVLPPKLHVGRRSANIVFI